MTITSTIKSWSGPTPSDKYLPIWVVTVMFGAVWLLSHQMTSAIKDVCQIKGRCETPLAVRENSTVAEVVEGAIKQAAESKVAEAMAAAASEPKAK